MVCALQVLMVDLILVVSGYMKNLDLQCKSRTEEDMILHTSKQFVIYVSKNRQKMFLSWPFALIHVLVNSFLCLIIIIFSAFIMYLLFVSLSLVVFHLMLILMAPYIQSG